MSFDMERSAFGRIEFTVPVRVSLIGSSGMKPPLPVELQVRESLDSDLSATMHIIWLCSQ